MDIATLPTRQPIPFAESAPAGNRQVIPQTSQIGITAGAASYPDGFPPVCLIPIASGGTPPWGRDVNGILYNLTLAARYIQAGGNYPYDSTFSTAVGGYPKGSLLLRSDAAGQWLSTADNNTTDPDSTASAGWIAVRANTGAQTIAMASGANVPTANQLGAQVLLLTGTLTANATLTLPLRAGAQWTVVNNTTGAFTVTVQGATGAGVSVTQGTGIIAYTDGTNFYAISAAVSGAYLPIGGTAVAATKLATARAFNLSGIVTTAGAVNFDGTANVTINITDIALTAAEVNTGLGYTAADDSNVVHKTGTETIGGTKTFSASISAANFTGSSSGTNTGDQNLAPYALVASPRLSSNVAASSNVADTSASRADAPGIQNGGGSGVGGTLLFGAGSINFGYIKGYFTDGSNNGLGRICIGTRTNATDTSMTVKLTIAENGAITATSSITATGGFQSSDRRLKKNIVARAVQRGFALKIAQMFSEWDRIADGIHDVGLVAQKVKAYAARYVLVGDTKKKILAIDKSGIALEASMDCALQLEEQKMQLKEQAKTIKALMRRIEKLEK